MRGARVQRSSLILIAILVVSVGGCAEAVILGAGGPQPFSLTVSPGSATLATGFGVSATDWPSIFPNLTNYTTSNLGFMG
jgi:hypothetical protein